MMQNLVEHDNYLTKTYGQVSGYVNNMHVKIAINYTGTNRFYIGQQPHILISDLDMIKQIMTKDFQNFPDHPVSLYWARGGGWCHVDNGYVQMQATPCIYMTTDQELTELPMATGDTWSRMRRILSPSFSTFRLKAVKKMARA